ncbi:MAG: carbohydrate ABC transporter permease [Clostridiales bacterium]|nr:carbohydrate ABC transporter permease [Clostridiales bacterium]
MSKKHIPIAVSDKIFYAVCRVLLVIVLLVTIYPLYFTVIASVSDLNAILNGEVLLWPVGFSFLAYEKIFSYDMLLIGYRNSIFYALAGTFLSVLVTIVSAYALSVKFVGRRIVMLCIVFSMFFGGGLIPTYFTYKYIGLINSVGVMIFPMVFNAYNLIMTRTFVSGIPYEMYEAAEIDGCSHFRYLVYVVIPLSTVIIAVISLFCTVSQWNSYFNAMMFINDKKLYPLQLVLRDVLILNSISTSDRLEDPIVAAQLNQMKELMKYSMIIVSMLPMMILYPFLQRYFVKGIMIGSVKG